MGLILTLNAGSSSIKFSLWPGASAEADRLLAGQIEQLGPTARIRLADGMTKDLGATDHAGALRVILDLVAQSALGQVAVVGHRIVHGGTDFVAPVALDAEVLARLRQLEPLAPMHQGHNLAAVAAAQAAFPKALQIGCFDTAFHRSHPWVNDTFALPRRFRAAGVRRYGFHGLSYDYISTHLAEAYPALAAGRAVVAHLGNGASLCAVQNGVSVASTMGFSALDGLPMGTRSGQIDPGVLLYLMQNHGMDAAELSDLLYKQSGLLGLSGLTSDMRSLEQSDAPEAAEAIAYFAFRATREIGAMAAGMGGIDGLVFTGGIGENSARARAEICAPLGFLGITLDADRNGRSSGQTGPMQISAGRVPVLVIPTDEELVIARACIVAINAS